MTKTLSIEIKNCNNIDSGSIDIFQSKLNIKFGINGTGKSTIARAIQYQIESPEKLEELTPFKHKNTDIKPEVSISEEIKCIITFNEEYLNQFVYKEDELISNSFEIFIKTPEYLENEEKIEKHLETIKKIFLENQELESIISDFESLSKSLKTTKSGLSETSDISKGLKKGGNKIDNIPEGLEEYKPFIQNREKCITWLDWQIKGNKFIENHDSCPYCTSITDELKKEKIKSVEVHYDKKIIEKFIVIIDALENLGDYFSDEAKEKLNKITKKTEGLLDEEKSYLFYIKEQVEMFLKKLIDLRNISFHDFKDNNIEKKINNLKIDLGLFDRLKSQKTKSIVEKFNNSLDETSEEITELKKNIGIHNKKINDSIKTNQKNINEFLNKAGYKYQVSITQEDKQYKLRLEHIDLKDEKISKGNQHLSFGEKNAFALVLFMYEALSKKSDLIVLDDPISSFDKNKKYAIMDMLFRQDNSFKGKTVLMLTHDMEPIIDTIKVLHKKFENHSKAYFISTQNHKILEEEITKNDLLSFSQICHKILESSNVDEVIKIIYLRRFYESIDHKSNEYEVLSNLLHKRSKEDSTDQRKDKIDGNYQKLSDTDFNNGVEEIKTKITSFDYDSLLSKLQDKTKLIGVYHQTNDSFAKIILFRILIDGLEKILKPDDVLMKFINEIYHIENDFIFQLNPEKYDITPQFIIENCDNFIKNITTTKQAE